jgi:hypothetical protein
MNSVGWNYWLDFRHGKRRSNLEKMQSTSVKVVACGSLGCLVISCPAFPRLSSTEALMALLVHYYLEDFMA